MDQQQLPPLGRPIYIQTYLPTADHIRKNSVLKVETVDDLTSNRLGVSAWESACEFCDNFMETCPGHDGSLELPVPIFRVFFVKRLISILNCICFYCQRLRMPRTDKNYAWIRSLPRKNRLKYLLKMSAPYKTCGQGTPTAVFTPKSYADQPSVDLREPCRKAFVQFRNEDKAYSFVRAVIRLDDADYQAYQNDPMRWRPVSIGPQDIYDCLCQLDAETKHMLGCDEWNDPSALMWEVLPVPCLNTRPTHTFAGLGAGKKRALNDWTKYLRDIVTARNELRRVMQLSSEKITCCHYIVGDVEHRNFKECFRYGFMAKKDVTDEVRKRFKADMKQANYGALESAWRELNKNTAAFHSHRHKKFIKKAAYGKPLVNVEERYKFQKSGRFRGNVVSRRVNGSGRGVLEGSMELEVDQAGIPIKEAMNLSVQVHISALNMREAQRWILNGPYVYPGANYVTMKDGKEINLAFYENRRDIDLQEVFMVQRHLIDNDVVIVSRQPTLHRPSNMSFRVKVVDGYCIRLHYAVFTPLGADCDGDEVNFQVIQGLEAQTEARQISSVAANIMKDGKIWIQFIQNPVIGADLMTRESVLLSISDATEVTMHLGLFHLPPPAMMSLEEKDAGSEFDPTDQSDLYEKARYRWTGHQLVSLMLPRDFTMISDKVVIRNGVLEKGRLNNSVLNGTNGILYHMYRDYADKTVVLRFIHQAYIMFQRYLDLFGHSVGYYDCAVDFEHEDQYRSGALDRNPQFKAIMERLERVQENVVLLNRYSDSLVGHTPDSPDEETEKNMLKHIGQLTSMGTEAAMEYHNYVNSANKDTNGLLHMIRSGAKGSDMTLNQMCMLVGEIAVMYRRFPQPSSHFLKGRDTAAAFGFIGQSYARGLSLTSVIVEAHAACEAVVNKSKGTSKPGYTIRKLTSCMGGIVIDYLGRAIDTHDRVIWAVYGNDGYDPQNLLTVKLPTQPIESDSAMLRDLRVQVKTLLGRCLDALSPTDTRAPFDFKHLLDRCENSVLGGVPHSGIHPSGVHPTIDEYARFADCLWDRLLREKLVVDTNLTLKLLFYHWLSVAELAKRNLSYQHLKWLAREIMLLLGRALVQPGESVGINATQNMGEPFAQLSLKTPHFSGKFTTVVAGTTRIANLIDGKFYNPQMTIVLKPSIETREQANIFGLSLSRCYIKDILCKYPTYSFHGRDDLERLCRVYLPVARSKCIDRLVSLRSAVRTLSKITGLPVESFFAPFMDGPDEELVLRIDVPVLSKFWLLMAQNPGMPNSTDALIAENLVFNLCQSIVIHGLAQIENFVTEEIKMDGESRWVITTLGSDLRHILRMPQVDSRRTVSNDVTEMCEVFGMYAARKSLEHEFLQVLSGKADSRHIKLVARVMASDLVIKGMKIKQVAQRIPPLQRAAYERGPEQMVEYCSVAERDYGKTICGAVLMNKTLLCGTGFNLTLKPIVDLPHQYLESPRPLATIRSYVFSPKADGVRYFLVLFHDRKGARIASLVDRTNTAYELPADDMTDSLFAGTVLDGELTQIGPRKYAFLVFDCLMCCGNKTSVLRYDQRVEIAREAVYRMNNKTLEGRVPLEMGADMPYCLPIAMRRDTSRFALPAGKLPFLVAVKPVFDMAGLRDYGTRIMPHLGFKFDGLVFTDLRDPAYPFRMRPTSMIKWKPRQADFNENTIDFIVTAATPDNILQDWPPRFRPADPRISQYRRFDPQQTNCWLWSTLPDRSMFCFSGGVCQMPGFAPNRVYECRWNYRFNNWEVVRWRNKDANLWETVVMTVQNIIENIEFSEFI